MGCLCCCCGDEDLELPNLQEAQTELEMTPQQLQSRQASYLIPGYIRMLNKRDKSDINPDAFTHGVSDTFAWFIGPIFRAGVVVKKSKQEVYVDVIDAVNFSDEHKSEQVSIDTLIRIQCAVQSLAERNEIAQRQSLTPGQKYSKMSSEDLIRIIGSTQGINPTEAPHYLTTQRELAECAATLLTPKRILESNEELDAKAAFVTLGFNVPSRDHMQDVVYHACVNTSMIKERDPRNSKRPGVDVAIPFVPLDEQPFILLKFRHRVPTATDSEETLSSDAPFRLNIDESYKSDNSCWGLRCEFQAYHDQQECQNVLVTIPLPKVIEGDECKVEATIGKYKIVGQELHWQISKFKRTGQAKAVTVTVAAVGQDVYDRFARQKPPVQLKWISDKKSKVTVRYLKLRSPEQTLKWARCMRTAGEYKFYF